MKYLTSLNNVIKLWSQGHINESSGHIERIAAMNNELKAIEQNDTWQLCDLQSGKKALDSKWGLQTETCQAWQCFQIEGQVSS